MGKSITDDPLNVEALGNYITTEVARDFIRIIEYCKDEIKAREIELKLWEKNPPANTSPAELEAFINSNYGQIYALGHLITILELRVLKRL